MNKLCFFLFFVFVSFLIKGQSDTLYFPETGIKAIGEYKDSLATGKWYCYNMDGTINSKGNYHKDKPVGTWFNYYSNGTINSILAYDSLGVLNGESQFYWENGQKITEIEYVNGKKNGFFKKFNESGLLFEKGQYSYDIKVGEWASYDKGNVIAIYNYDSTGRLNGVLQYFDNVKKEVEEFYYVDDKKEGKTTLTSFDGVLIYEGEYKNDVLEGSFIHYWSNGNVKKEVHYLNGNLDGVFMANHVNGILSDQGQYKYDIRVGSDKSYNTKGDLISEYNFNDIGQLHGVQFFITLIDSSGLGNDSTYSYVNYMFNEQDGATYTIRFNGDTVFSGYHKNDLKHGVWRWYWSGNRLKSLETHYEGQLEGLWETYFKDGNIEESGHCYKNVRTNNWIEYSNGDNTKYCKGTYVNGVKDGVWSCYLDSELVERILFVAGEQVE